MNKKIFYVILICRDCREGVIFNNLSMSKDNKNVLEKDLEFNDSNIFEDFKSDSDKDLKNSVNNYKKREDKNIYDHILTIWNIFKYMNLFFFLILTNLFLYIFIQNNENFSNSPVLDYICFVIAWDNAPTKEHCSSISSLLKDYNFKLKYLKLEQFNSIVGITQPIYTVTNFISSRDLIFLLDKSSSRLRPIEILEEFDDLKNDFEFVDKSKIICSNLEIRSSNILTATCDAFSSNWESGLVNFDWEISKTSISWTSISVASSFLNFIEKKSDKFTLINKQKEFNFEYIAWEKPWYTKKTRFNINLKYNSENLPL